MAPKWRLRRPPEAPPYVGPFLAYFTLLKSRNVSPKLAYFSPFQREPCPMFAYFDIRWLTRREFQMRSSDYSCTDLFVSMNITYFRIVNNLREPVVSQLDYCVLQYEICKSFEWQNAWQASCDVTHVTNLVLTLHILGRNRCIFYPVLGSPKGPTSRGASGGLCSHSTGCLRDQYIRGLLPHRWLLSISMNHHWSWYSGNCSGYLARYWH